ncbi:hypothetical protein DFH09DRAFT_1098851 [Mycena vulgaris]|nr:hypothetical protein DFH09DRAFT_1098851 [Mycena vulgaris]
MKNQGIQLDRATSKDFYGSFSPNAIQTEDPTSASELRQEYILTVHGADDAEYIQFAVQYLFQRTTRYFAGSTALAFEAHRRQDRLRLYCATIAFAAAARSHLTKTGRGVKGKERSDHVSEG